MAFPIVTVPMAKAMREFRQAGAKYLEIVKLFDLSYSTVVYHCNPEMAEKLKAAWRRRQARILSDPEARKAYNAYQKKRQRARRALERNL